MHTRFARIRRGVILGRRECRGREADVIKVLWFLKRADHLSLAEFQRWWLERHAPDIVADQSPHLKRYVLHLKEPDDSMLAGRPASECPWDGVAEQWFETEEDYNAVYGRADRPTRQDTLAHTSRFERLVVRQVEIDVGRG
jgi:hypothetical protein